MSIQRFIHPSIWTDERFCALSDKAKLLYIGIVTTSDDHGRRRAEPELLKADIFPLERRTTLKRIIALRNEVESAGLARVYGNGRYMDLPRWSRYQKPKYRKPSKIPEFSAPNPGRTRAEPGPSRPGTRSMGLGLGLGSSPPSEEKPPASAAPRKLGDSPSPVHQFLDFWAREFQARTGAECPALNFGKDGKLVKEMLERYDLHQLKDLVVRLWTSDDEFIRKASKTIGLFKSQLPKLLSAGVGGVDPNATPPEVERAMEEAGCFDTDRNGNPLPNKQVPE